MEKTDLTDSIRQQLLSNGADLVGIGDLTELPTEARKNMPIGICVAVKYPDEIIQGIVELPTPEYYEWYDRLNKRLDVLVSFGARIIRQLGYKAIAQTRQEVGFGEKELHTALPHKTVATRASIGWIGKSALLVTKEYGSMVRLSTILTDAPLEVDKPVNSSSCGDCMVCTEACPAEAVSGKNWEPGLYRDEFFDPVKCLETARERAIRGAGVQQTICGKCIAVCPHTIQAWK